LYVVAGFLTGHFARSFVPARGELTIRGILGVIRGHLRAPRRSENVPPYNVLQRLAYTTIVFVVLPLMICTGLAMSPAVTSVLPLVVTVFGGQQSARTIHFVVACALTVFALLHVTLVWQSGFKAQMRAMITGRVGRGGRTQKEAA
jgi:thiosulfate reductase cytochrome b subunit